MLTTIQAEINQCTCDLCRHSWKSLTIPTNCPQCHTRTWNGAKTRGRPRNPLQPHSKPARGARRSRKELSEYSHEW